MGFPHFYTNSGWFMVGLDLLMLRVGTIENHGCSCTHLGPQAATAARSGKKNCSPQRRSPNEAPTRPPSTKSNPYPSRIRLWRRTLTGSPMRFRGYGRVLTTAAAAHGAPAAGERRGLGGGIMSWSSTRGRRNGASAAPGHGGASRERKRGARE